MRVTYQGVVYPAQCDAMGHFTVQHYVAAFDQSLWHLMAASGYDARWIAERRQGWADVRYELDFRRELPAGSLYVIESAVTRVGRTSLTSRHLLKVPGIEAPAAELLATSVYFDLAARKAHPLPPEILAVVGTG